MDIGDPLRKDLIHAVCKRCFSDDREVSGGALHTAWVRHCIGSSHLSFFATNRAAEKQEGKALATWAAVLRNATGTTRVLVLVLCLGSFVFFVIYFSELHDSLFVIPLGFSLRIDKTKVWHTCRPSERCKEWFKQDSSMKGCDTRQCEDEAGNSPNVIYV